MDRQMAYVENISAIYPIEGADSIEEAKIRGWSVVVQKDTFSVGDQVIYFEVDSALPLLDSRFSYLSSRGSRLIDGKPYHVLRTIRLRGTYSQGLAIPYHEFAHDILSVNSMISQEGVEDYTLEDYIGVFKYEPPVPQSIGGQIAGGFIDGIPKTDAKRIQNLSPKQYQQLLDEGRWVFQEKIDGTSGTFYNDPEEGIRVASRNWELAPSEDQVHWKMVDKYDLQNRIPVGWTIQAEVAGPSIQKNPLALKEVSLFVFRVLDEERRDVPRILWPEDLKLWAAPIYEDLTLPPTIEEAVEMINGIKSLVTPGRLTEGVVVWDVDGREFRFLGRPAFKIISNKFILKNDN